LWNVHTRNPIAILKGHTDNVEAAAFGPDNTMLATASYDGTIRLWNIRNRRSVRTLTAPLNHFSFTDLCFNPDDSTVLAAATIDEAITWNAQTGQVTSERPDVGDYPDVSAPWALVCDPAGGTILTTYTDNTTRIWGYDGQPVTTLAGHAAAVVAVAISPDDTLIATASDDHTARLWSHPLLTYSIDGSSNLDIQQRTPQPQQSRQPDAAIAAVCFALHRNLTLQEWKQYLPDQSYKLTCAA